MGARLCCCRNLARPSSCPLGYPAGVSAAVAIKREARRKHKPKRAEIMMPERRSAEAARQDRAWSLVAQDRQNASQATPIRPSDNFPIEGGGRTSGRARRERKPRRALGPERKRRNDRIGAGPHSHNFPPRLAEMPELAAEDSAIRRAIAGASTPREA